jgi:hypothetical protein
LTATFVDKPTQPDLVITEYMEMLLENGELFQEYMDMQPNLDSQIHSVSVVFYETVRPTSVQDTKGQSPDAGNSVNGATSGEATTTTDEEKETNMWMIVGITLGCFIAMLLIILMYGILSSGTTN